MRWGAAIVVMAIAALASEPRAAAQRKGGIRQDVVARLTAELSSSLNELPPPVLRATQTCGWDAPLLLPRAVFVLQELTRFTPYDAPTLSVLRRAATSSDARVRKAAVGNLVWHTLSRFTRVLLPRPAASDVAHARKEPVGSLADVVKDVPCESLFLDLREPDPSCHEGVAAELANYCPSDPLTIPTLSELATHGLWNERDDAAGALARIGSDEAIDALAKALLLPDHDFQRQILFLLREMGPRAARAGPSVRALLGHWSNDIRARAASTLGELTDSPVLPFLRTCPTAERRSTLELDGEAVPLRPVQEALIPPSTCPPVAPGQTDWLAIDGTCLAMFAANPTHGGIAIADRDGWTPIDDAPDATPQRFVVTGTRVFVLEYARISELRRDGWRLEPRAGLPGRIISFGVSSAGTLGIEAVVSTGFEGADCAPAARHQTSSTLYFALAPDGAFREVP